MTRMTADELRIPAAAPSLYACLARALAPRKPMTVSEWADANRVLSTKASPVPGKWRTSRNPPIREIMDAMSARSRVRDMVVILPIQSAKSEICANVLGYAMDHYPGPVMVVLPGEVSLDKWVNQKLNPLIDNTKAVGAALRSQASRNSANTRTFKDFTGGQLYMEHAGSPLRLVQSTIRTLIVDETDKFARALNSGDNPLEMLKGRTSAYQSTYQRLFVGTPEIKGISALEELYEQSDRRRYYVPCPYCQHEQPLEWTGLHYTPDGKHCWYVCRECEAQIDEHHKTGMIAAGRWVAENPGAKIRGYHLNCLYYPLGLGPRWLTLVEQWRAAQNDPAKLKTFVNERLAEAWEDQNMRRVRHNALIDRAESYRLRTAPVGVLAITAGVDTQDDRLEVQIIGWGRGLACWVLDYVVLPGDPAEPEVWVKLVDLLNRPIQHELGSLMRIEATAIDAGGHRTEAVKAFVRQRQLRRCIPIFGAVPNNAPVLSKGKLQDVNWRGQLDKRGVVIHHVGTVGIKHLLYSRLSADADRPPEARLVHLSQDLDAVGVNYFAGLVGEIYNPARNRFERRGGTRVEPLDTWVYAYAATHHPELRLHRHSKSDWDVREARLASTAGPRGTGPVVMQPPGRGARDGWGAVETDDGFARVKG
jgi:phage terminase large subunit GpA-like protein